MWRWTAVIVLGFLGGAPASAQPAVTRPQNSIVAQGLVARYEAALIRERRLADERESVLIAGFESRIFELRTRSQGGSTDAFVDLAQARDDYAACVAEIIRRDSAARVLSISYQTQAREDVGQASPEQLAALQLFADGDLDEGFRQFEAESRRRSDARQHAARAADAADARQLARMGETRLRNGLATTRDTLALFQRALDLDGDDAEMLLTTAQLRRELGELDDALATVDRGLTLSLAPELRALLLQERGRILYERADYAGARDALLQSRAATEQVAPGDVGAQRGLIATLYRLGDTYVRLGDNVAARTAYTQAIDEARTLGGAAPDSEVLARELATALEKLGDAQLGAGNLAEARNLYRERLTIARRLATAHPQAALLQRDLAMGYERLGDVMAEEGELRGALSLYRDRQRIILELLRADPDSVLLQRDAWVSLWKLVQFPESGVTWTQVFEAMDAMQRRGVLAVADRSAYELARENAANEHTTN